MIAFEVVGDRETGAQFIDQLKMVLCAVSLGDTETLIASRCVQRHDVFAQR